MLSMGENEAILKQRKKGETIEAMAQAWNITNITSGPIKQVYRQVGQSNGND